MVREITYKKYVKNIESLTYTYKEDLETLYDFESNFNNIFTSEKGHPLLYRFYLRSKVHINTCVILNDLVDYAKLWRKQDDMMLNEFLICLTNTPSSCIVIPISTKQNTKT